MYKTWSFLTRATLHCAWRKLCVKPVRIKRFFPVFFVFFEVLKFKSQSFPTLSCSSYLRGEISCQALFIVIFGSASINCAIISIDSIVVQCSIYLSCRIRFNSDKAIIDLECGITPNSQEGQMHQQIELRDNLQPTRCRSAHHRLTCKQVVDLALVVYIRNETDNR